MSVVIPFLNEIFNNFWNEMVMTIGYLCKPALRHIKAASRFVQGIRI